MKKPKLHYTTKHKNFTVFHKDTKFNFREKLYYNHEQIVDMYVVLIGNCIFWQITY